MAIAALGDSVRKITRGLPHIVLALCLLMFSAKAVTSMVQKSSTWDETHYFGIGKYLLQNRTWDVPGAILHPPLSYYLQSIPLLFFPTDQRLWKPDPSRAADLHFLAGNDGADIRRGEALLSSPSNHGDRLLTLSRLMMVLTAVLLGCFVYAWSYHLFGPKSAVLAAVLFAFSPNILAHARLITPDITVTTFSFISLYFLWQSLVTSRLAHAILGGVSLGLCLLSKFTGVLLIPIALLLIAAWWARERKVRAARIACFFGVGVLVLFLGYGMDITPYLQGISFQNENARYHPSFLLGHYSDTGWWYYLTVAFLLKTPIALLVLLAMAFALLLKDARRAKWVDEAFLLLPAVFIFGFFSIRDPSIGLRYVLPVYPFAFVFASRVADALLASRTRAAVLAGLCAWYIAASSWIHPHYLAYFNEFGGGPSNGYKYLVDSNLDWGQDLKGLKRFLDEHGIPRVYLSYFGTDLPERYGIAYDWLPSIGLPGPADGRFRRPSPGDWLAISVTNLQGVYFDDKDLFGFLRNRTPVAQIGYSIFIYRL